MSLHKQRTHPGADVPGCFGCAASSIQFATAPTDDRRRSSYESQKQWAAEFHNGDREAYRRLRANGLQPPRIAGSAHLEKHAESRFEVETGAVTDNRKGLSTALKLCADAGIDPLKANTKPVSD